MQNNWLTVAILILFTEIGLKLTTGKGLVDRLYIAYILAKIHTIAFMINTLAKIILKLNKSLKRMIDEE